MSCSVVSLECLTVQQGWIDIDGRVGGLLVRSAFTLVAGDLTNARVAHIGLQRNEVDHYTPAVLEPRRVAAGTSGSTIAIASNRGCLSAVFWDGAVGDGREVAVPGRLVSAERAGGSMLVLAHGGYWMQRIDLATMRAGPVVALPDGLPGTARVAYLPVVSFNDL